MPTAFLAICNPLLSQNRRCSHEEGGSLGMNIYENHLPPQTKPAHLDTRGDGEVSESSLNSVHVVMGELDLSNDDMASSAPTRGRPRSRLRNPFRSRARSCDLSRACESDATSVASRASVSSKASRSSCAGRSRSRSNDGVISQIKVVPVPPSPNGGSREERMRWKEVTRRMSFFDDETDSVETKSSLDDFVEEFTECSYFFRCLMDDTVETLKADKAIQEQLKHMQRRGHNVLPKNDKQRGRKWGESLCACV